MGQVKFFLSCFFSSASSWKSSIILIISIQRLVKILFRGLIWMHFFSILKGNVFGILTHIWSDSQGLWWEIFKSENMTHTWKLFFLTIFNVNPVLKWIRVLFVLNWEFWFKTLSSLEKPTTIKITKANMVFDYELHKISFISWTADDKKQNNKVLSKIGKHVFVICNFPVICFVKR